MLRNEDRRRDGKLRRRDVPPVSTTASPSLGRASFDTEANASNRSYKETNGKERTITTTMEDNNIRDQPVDLRDQPSLG